MVGFCTMVNISSGVNCYVMLKAYNDTPNINRLDFMKALTQSLVAPLIQERLERGYLVADS